MKLENDLKKKKLQKSEAKTKDNIRQSQNCLDGKTKQEDIQKKRKKKHSPKQFKKSTTTLDVVLVKLGISEESGIIWKKRVANLSGDVKATHDDALQA